MATPRSVREERLALGSFGFAVVALLTSNILFAFGVAYVPVRYGMEIGATLACCICIVVVFVRHHIEKRALLVTLAGITCIGVAKLLDVAAIESRGMELTGMTRNVFAHAVTNSFVGPGLILLLLSFLLVMITSSHHANAVVEQGRRLQESEGRLRAVVDTAADGIITIDAEGTIMTLNRAAVRIFGYDGDEGLIGRNVAVLMPPPDHTQHDRYITDYLCAGTKKIIGTGREVIGQRKDGSRFPLDLAISETQVQDRPTFTGIVRDITERRKAEQALQESETRFRQIAENISNVFYLVELSPYGLVYVSPAFEEVWGISRKTLEKDPTAWLDAVHPDDCARVRARFQKSPTWQHAVSNEYRIVRPDGSERWIRDRAFPVRDDAGRPYRLAGIAADITDVKEAEAALRRTNEELAQANARLAQEMAERSRAEERARRHQDELAHVARLSTMGEMAAGLAHELNQPLAAIQNYTGACERMLRSGTADSPRLLEGMMRASAECQRAATIIRRLRSFIRRRQPQLSAFDINHLARDATEFMAHDLRQSHVAVQLELDPAVPAVIGDTIQIEQVVLNLLRNALEAMADTPDDARRIVIRTAPVASQMVEVAVSDVGCGLPAEGGDRLFDLFVTTKPDGMGLGLGISRSIIEAHHGRLSAAANGDAGATFRFTLPFANPNP